MNIPERSEEEWSAIGKRLGKKMAEFVGDYLQYRIMEDKVLQQTAIENYREEVERATQAGLECPQAWFILATAIEEPDERLRALFRVLQSLEAEFEITPPRQPSEWWDQTQVYAETYYELGRMHARASRSGAARDSFERALSFANSLRALRPLITGPSPDYEDKLEGKIAAASLMLDD